MKKNMVLLSLALVLIIMILLVYQPDTIDPFVYQETKEGVVDYLERDLGVYVRVEGDGLFFVHSNRLDNLSKGQFVKVNVYSRRFTGRKKLIMEHAL